MPTPDNFTTIPASAPAFDGAAVTPSDTVDMAKPARALWLGTAGTVVLDTLAGTTLTVVGASAGVLPIACKRVRATGTTATLILALF
jgi:hypothetical protein